MPPGKVGDAGRSGPDNRLFVNGCLWVLRSGAHWKDLPERYGKWKTVHRRFSRWCHAGVWDRIFEMLTADRDNPYLMFDTNHRSRPSAGCKRKRGSRNQAPGRSRGGLTTRIHTLGRPLRFMITAGQAGDVTQAQVLLAGQKGAAVIADGPLTAMHYVPLSPRWAQKLSYSYLQD